MGLPQVIDRQDGQCLGSGTSQAIGPQNVALLAIGVVQQRDARRAIRVVLDRRHLGRNPGFVASKIDDSVAPLVTATAKTHRGAAFVVAATRAALALGELLLGLALGDLLERRDR